MGIRLFSSSSIDEPIIKYITNTEVINNNPDPKNFTIQKFQEWKGHSIIWINYPECTNYEGNKILVFDYTLNRDIINWKLIDPHFSNSTKFKSPIARFEPTQRGWKLANNMCKFLKINRYGTT